MMQRILRGALGLLIVLAATLGTQWIARHILPDIAAMLVTAAAALLAYAAQARWIERRAPRELAPAALAGVPLGFALGCGLFATTIALLALFGYYRFQGFSSWQPLTTGLTLALVSGVVEELLFRGFLFRWLQSTVGTWLAVAASAIVFGLAHAFNPGATPVSTLAIAMEAGILLSAAYVIAGNLWLPIGLHAGWNFTEGTVFGLAVSGQSAHGILRGATSGPTILTGGAFGVEASVVAVGVCLALATALLVVAFRQHLTVQPAWLARRQSALMR